MFVHQNYDLPGPQGEYECVRPTRDDVIDLTSSEADGSDRSGDAESRCNREPEFDHDLRSSLVNSFEELASAGFRRVVLLRGSFVGADSFGMARKLSRVWKRGAALLQSHARRTIDHWARDAGNFDDADIDLLRSFAACAGLSLETLAWSGENHHAGRADGAVRLIRRLHELENGATSEHGRTILIGHSHGGNVIALASQLWGGADDRWSELLRAARTLYRSPLHRLGSWFSRVDQPSWLWALEHGSPRIDFRRCAVATLGAPVRYGWENCDELLHFINHSPLPGSPPDEAWRVQFPPPLASIVGAVGEDHQDRSGERASSIDPRQRASGGAGDIVQQLGVAGTNLSPTWLSYRVKLANRRLRTLLQPGIRRRDLLKRLRRGVRLHDRGLNLLVDYQLADQDADDVLGHAVYTRRRWWAFHFRQLATRWA